MFPKNNMKKWYLGFVSACLATALFLSAVAALSTYFTKGRIWGLFEFFITVVCMFLLTLPIGTLALPVATILHVKGLHTSKVFAFVGSATALALFVASQSFVFQLQDYLTFSPYVVLLLLIVSGTISGLTFWSISENKHNNKIETDASYRLI